MKEELPSTADEAKELTKRLFPYKGRYSKIKSSGGNLERLLIQGDEVVMDVLFYSTMSSVRRYGVDRLLFSILTLAEEVLTLMTMRQILPPPLLTPVKMVRLEDSLESTVGQASNRQKQMVRNRKQYLDTKLSGYKTEK